MNLYRPVVCNIPSRDVAWEGLAGTTKSRAGVPCRTQIKFGRYHGEQFINTLHGAVLRHTVTVVWIMGTKMGTIAVKSS